MCFPKPAVSAVIVRDGEILLVKRGCEPNMGLWSLPGGSIELGETLQEALAREVLEETSLEVEPGDIAGVYDVIVKDGDTVTFHYVIISLFAKIIFGEPAAASDAADLGWVKLEDVSNYPTTAGLVERLRAFGLDI